MQEVVVNGSTQEDDEELDDELEEHDDELELELEEDDEVGKQLDLIIPLQTFEPLEQEHEP